MRTGLLILLCGLMFPLYAQETKKTIAVLEFQSAGGLEKNELSILTNRFRGILVQTNAFEVIERDKMGEILKEQDFSMSDHCNSAECAVQIGQLLGVKYMIAGDISKFGQTYAIDLRMISVKTGKIEQTKTKDYVGKYEGLLDEMKKIAQDFSGGSGVSGGTVVQSGKKSSNMKWYILGGAVIAGGGAAAVLLGGKKSSSDKGGINWPLWP